MPPPDDEALAISLRHDLHHPHQPLIEGHEAQRSRVRRRHHPLQQRRTYILGRHAPGMIKKLQRNAHHAGSRLPRREQMIFGHQQHVHSPLTHREQTRRRKPFVFLEDDPLHVRFRTVQVVHHCTRLRALHAIRCCSVPSTPASHTARILPQRRNAAVLTDHLPLAFHRTLEPKTPPTGKE